jgi:hypothetical protein
MMTNTNINLVSMVGKLLGYPAPKPEPIPLPLPVWMEFDLPVTEAELLDIVGEPCPDYEEDCPVCKAHLQFYAKGTIPMLEERNTMLHLAKGCFYVEDGEIHDIMSGRERMIDRAEDTGERK